MNKRYQILDCEVDFTEQTLVRAGEVFKQQHKVMQVLRCLLNKQGELEYKGKTNSGNGSKKHIIC